MNKEQLVTNLHKKVFLPLTSGSPERTHNLVFTTLSHIDNSDRILDSLRKEFRSNNMPKVSIDALETEFPSPFLLAGGLIKTGVGAATISQLGVGGEEIGTLTLESRDGNPLTRKEFLSNDKEIKIKRIERFNDGTIINWMGLPNPGIKKVLETLTSAKEKIDVPIFINIFSDPTFASLNSEVGKGAMQDLTEILTLAYVYRPNAITVNISCPNVETRGDRDIRFKDALRAIKTAAEILDSLELKFKYKVPRLAKIGPDMSSQEIKEITMTIKENNYEGVVATNTTSDRTGARAKYAYIQKGGLSGPLLLEKSLETVRLVRKYDKELGGSSLVIIGCGGIGSYKDCLRMREAGSDKIVELMSGFIYGGPYFFKRLNLELQQNESTKKYY